MKCAPFRSVNICLHVRSWFLILAVGNQRNSKWFGKRKTSSLGTPRCACLPLAKWNPAGALAIMGNDPTNIESWSNAYPKKVRPAPYPRTDGKVRLADNSTSMACYGVVVGTAVVTPYLQDPTNSEPQNTRKISSAVMTGLDYRILGLASGVLRA